jgi:hypothetical protein
MHGLFVLRLAVKVQKFAIGKSRDWLPMAVQLVRIPLRLLNAILRHVQSAA